MKYKLKAQTITISAMKEKFDIETNDPVTDDAGYSLVSRKEKKKSKKIKTKHDSYEKMTCTPYLVLDQFMGQALIFYPQLRRDNETC